MATAMHEPRATTNPLAVFEEYRQEINRSLVAYFAEAPELPVPLTPVAEQALGMIAEFTLRPGKRVRGALAALAYDNLSGQRLSASGQKLAVVMELLQSYLLVLDDVTDLSEMRRGEPTVHRLYEHAYDRRISSRTAEQLASYAAMIIQHLANVLLLEAAESADRIRATAKRMHQNVALTGFGQMDDVLQQVGEEADKADIIRKYTLKTSYYTFVNPLQMGMALAGVTDEVVYKQVAAFGVAAGIAFQLHDDYLGIFGSQEKTGKPSADDIREGKLTLLMQYALEHGSEADIHELKRYLGNPDVGDVEVQKVRDILSRSGATMEVQAETRRYASEAKRELAGITVWDKEFKLLLEYLVEYAISRES